MRLSRIAVLVLIACVSLSGSGCDSANEELTFAPTEPTTETFSGTLTPNGATTLLFTALGSGSISAVYTALGTDNTPVVGLAMGTWNGTACTLVMANDNAIVGIPISATLSAAASLCVRVYDSRGLAEAATYTVSVTHP